MYHNKLYVPFSKVNIYYVTHFISSILLIIRL